VQDDGREAHEDKDRDYDMTPERDDRAMMNDEVNVMRNARSEPEPEFGLRPQKMLE